MIVAIPRPTPKHPTEVYIVPNNKLLTIICLALFFLPTLHGGKIPVPKFPQQ